MDSKEPIKLSYCPVKRKVLERSGCAYVSPETYKMRGHLNEFTFTFITDPFDLSQIDKDKSLEKVQPRLTSKVNQDYVARYSFCLEDGDEFPGLVLFKEKGEWFIADGIHTSYALEKNKTNFVSGVFIFAHPDPIGVAATFNSRTTGNSESINDTLEKAVRLYRKKEEECTQLGIAPPVKKDWANTFAIPEHKFNVHYRLTALKGDLAKEGIDAGKIEDSTLVNLDKLRRIDTSAGTELAKAITEFSIKPILVSEIVNDYLNPNNSQKNETLKNRIQEIKKITNNGKLPSKNRKRKNTREITFKESISKLDNLSTKVDLSALRLLMKDKDMAESVARIQKFLRNLTN